MGAEYVRLTGEEALFQKKGLLETQMNVLQAVKRLKAYRAIREEELLLKIQLKQKCDALSEQIELLNRLLPTTEFKAPVQKEQISVVKQKTPEAHSSTLEEELASIQQKLQALQ